MRTDPTIMQVTHCPSGCGFVASRRVPLILEQSLPIDPAIYEHVKYLDCLAVVTARVTRTPEVAA